MTDLTEINMCATAKSAEKTSNGMLAMRIPENTNIADGMIDSNNAFVKFDLFHNIIHIAQ